MATPADCTRKQIGYCTNIHSGRDLDEIIANLTQFAIPVKEKFSPQHPMRVGLWFSDRAVKDALQRGRADELSQHLQQSGLVPYTVNAFPFSNFHQPVIKKLVYQPDWAESQRLEYTLSVIRLLHDLLPAEQGGSISTLPLGWPNHPDAERFLEMCAVHLHRCAEKLESLESTSGRKIVLCIEPEPGCCLQTSADVTRFFHQYLFSKQESRQRNQRYINVCHDICHAAVMFEKQADVLQAYRDSGINVGKVQVSSALQANFDAARPKLRAEILKQLREFCEPRYLHQTVISQNKNHTFYEDLPLAIADQDNEPGGIWRTHFHVPIDLSNVGLVETTQQEILRCLDWFSENGQTCHFETETYAWGVSPDRVQTRDMVECLANELTWLDERIPDTSAI